MMDLHSGRIAGWWGVRLIDLGTLILVVLTFSGLIMRLRR